MFLNYKITFVLENRIKTKTNKIFPWKYYFFLLNLNPSIIYYLFIKSISLLNVVLRHSISIITLILLPLASCFDKMSGKIIRTKKKFSFICYIYWFSNDSSDLNNRYILFLLSFMFVPKKLFTMQRGRKYFKRFECDVSWLSDYIANGSNTVT